MSGSPPRLEIEIQDLGGPQALPHCPYEFPPAGNAGADGVIGAGGDFSPSTVVAAYRQGIFPWPHPEQMGMCPWLPELLDGLLGSDIVGFQTPQHGRNFLELAARSGRQVSQPANASEAPQIVHCGHTTQVRDYPISIAWPTTVQTAALPSVASCRRQAQAQWLLPPNGRLIIGIDRFDYTKGIIERLHAFEHLLDTHPQWQGLVRFVQIAAPTRTGLKEYTDFQNQVLAEVTRINARFVASDGVPPIVLLDAHHGRAALDALYRAADICLVTSLHDGMNLVCKEFVAARSDEQGVLVLSQFAGAANELAAALIVNPYHTVQVADALNQALSMERDEQRRRMRALRDTVKTANVYRWAACMLLDAAALRAPTPEVGRRVLHAQATRGDASWVAARAGSVMASV